METNEIWDYRNPYEWMQKTASSSLPPLIICVAITGGVQGKEANQRIAGVKRNSHPATNKQ